MSYERLLRGPDRPDPDALDEDARARAVQRVPGKRTLTESLEPAAYPVQRRVLASAEADPARVQAAAQRGISGSSGRLPHLGRIQQLFGRHDVSGVQAHLGADASAAAEAMGAAAYATGSHVAFAGAPDLHTAAHEAAHVVQQRAGIHLKAGVGEAGDEHERHADAVADRVVAGRSAEDLLDRYRAPGGAAPAVQRAVKAKKVGDSEEVKSYNTLGGLATLFELDDGDKRAFAAQMKTRLFATAVFPQPYKDQFDTNPAVKEELSSIINGVNDLIRASTSDTVISVAAKQGAALADALFGIIGGGITADYVRGKDYQHYKMLSLGLAGDGATNYLTFVKTRRARLLQYKAAIRLDRYDAESRKTNALSENRIEVLTAKATALEDELRTKLTEHASTAATLAKLTDFQTEIAAIEAAIDLDFRVDQGEVQDQLESLQSDETEHNSYANGGVDDERSVNDVYVVGLACSLFALLAVVPGFMGANSAPDLHKILRRTEKLKAYDEDASVAQIRLLAGLTPTMEGGRQLGAIIQEILDAGDARPNFIADPTGQAHTFAVLWVNGAYRPKDNGESDSNTDIMNTRAFREKRIGTTWRL